MIIDIAKWTFKKCNQLIFIANLCYENQLMNNPILQLLYFEHNFD